MNAKNIIYELDKVNDRKTFEQWKLETLTQLERLKPQPRAIYTKIEKLRYSFQSFSDISLNNLDPLKKEARELIETLEKFS